MNIYEFRRLDVNYSHFVGDPFPLMKEAGSRVADFIMGKMGQGKRILVVCGTGNKCGDALVAAEKLRHQNQVTVILIRGRGGIKTGMALKALNAFHGNIADLSSLNDIMKDSQIIIDGLLGTGISGKVREPYRSVIKAVNESSKIIVSVDVPSGFPGDFHVKPAYTVTFHAIKDGMNRKNSGEIMVEDIGIPEEMERISGPGDFVYLPIPEKDSHKGMNGALAIVGGWTFHGSAILSALGALCTAPDLVNIIAPHDMKIILSSYSPEIIVRDFVDVETLIQDTAKMKSMVIGPGMGRSKEKEQVIVDLLRELKVPAVLDADAIHMMAPHADMINPRLVFTPHSAEFKALTGMEANAENLRTFSKKHDCTIVLKGSTDLIARKGEIFHTIGGNPRLTMGGTGDLLAGILGGFLSKGIDPVVAARMATYIEKRASEMAFQKKSYWYGITDLIDNIPIAIRESWEKCNAPS